MSFQKENGQQVVYPGSFDPITLGHVDVIQRLSQVFKRVTVLVSSSSSKNYLFNLNERMNLVQESLEGIDNVQIEKYDGLTVNFAKENNISVIARGIRNTIDFENEYAMATMNKKLNSSIETLFMLAAPEHNSIASRLVKEIARHNGDLHCLVPSCVEAAMKQKIK